MQLLNSSNPVLRNIRSSTEFESWKLFIYQVDTGLIGVDNSKPKLSATSQSMSVYNEQWKYDKSQSLSLMLKFLIIIIMLFKFISVFFKYFKIFCWSSELG